VFRVRILRVGFSEGGGGGAGRGCDGAGVADKDRLVPGSV